MQQQGNNQIIPHLLIYFKIMKQLQIFNDLQLQSFPFETFYMTI